MPDISPRPVQGSNISPAERFQDVPSDEPPVGSARKQIEQRVETIEKECNAIRVMSFQLGPESGESQLQQVHQRLAMLLEETRLPGSLPATGQKRGRELTGGIWNQEKKNRSGPHQDPSYDPFKELYNNVTAQHEGKLKHYQLNEELGKVSELAISQSNELRKLRVPRVDANGKELDVEYPEFRQAMDELYSKQYRSFCQAAGVVFSEKLYASLDEALHNGTLKNEGAKEGDSFQALRRLGELDERKRAELMLERSLSCLPDVVVSATKILAAEQQYHQEQRQINSGGKFDGDMVLCDDWIFTQGLEMLVGFPEFSSKESILEAIYKEHNFGKHADAEFTAFNGGRDRKTTPKKEWRRMMPEGKDGKICTLDYNLKPMLYKDGRVEDFMEHPKVKEAGLTKYEVICLRLYTGPLFSQYNNRLRDIGLQFETILKEKREERKKVRGAGAATASTNGSAGAPPALFQAEKRAVTVRLKDVTAWGDDEQRDLKSLILELIKPGGPSAASAKVGALTVQITSPAAQPAGAPGVGSVVSAKKGLQKPPTLQSAPSSDLMEESSLLREDLPLGSHERDSLLGDILPSPGQANGQNGHTAYGSFNLMSPEGRPLQSNGQIPPLDTGLASKEGSPNHYAQTAPNAPPAMALTNTAAGLVSAEASPHDSPTMAPVSVPSPYTVEFKENPAVIQRRLRLATTLELQVTVAGFANDEEWKKAVDQLKDAKDKTCLPYLTGPKKAKGLAALSHIEFTLPEERVDDEKKIKQEALREARKKVGDFPYVSTVHAITSALIKVSRITPTPSGGKVYRGMAGRNVSERFLNPTDSGARVGDELGFMSTTTDKEVAIGYIQKDLQHKMMYEIDVGQIDRGADIDFLSLFPGEKEVLFPPNSCLEVVGAARHEYSKHGVLVVWPLRVNINLKSLTIEDFQGMRKKLLLEAANNTLHLVDAFLSHESETDVTAESTAASAAAAAETVHVKLKESIRDACKAEVEALKEPGEEEYNDDITYCIAYEWLTDIRPLAEDAMALSKVDAASMAISVKNQTMDRQAMVRLTSRLLRKDTIKDNPPMFAEHAEKLCRMKKLYKRHKEELNGKGHTPLLHWSSEGYFSAVGLLLDAKANPNAVDENGQTTLHLAAKGNSQHVVKEWISRNHPTEMLNKNGYTALMVAAEHNGVASIQMLLQGGAKVGVVNKEGKTALFLAAEKGHAGALQALIDGGAEVNTWCSGNGGKTALFAAAESKNDAAFDTLMKGGASMDGDMLMRNGVLRKLEMFILLSKDAYYYKLIEWAEDEKFKGKLLTPYGQSVYLHGLEDQWNKAQDSLQRKAALDKFVKVARYLMDVGGKEQLGAAYGVLQAGIASAGDAVDEAGIARVKMLGLMNELYGRKRYVPHKEGFKAISEQMAVLDQARSVLTDLTAPKDQTYGEEILLEEATVFEGTGYLYLYNKKDLMADVVGEEKEEHFAEYWFQKEVDVLYTEDHPREEGEMEKEEQTLDPEVLAELPVPRIRKLTDALNALGTAFEVKLRNENPEQKQEHMAYKQALNNYTLSVQVGKDWGHGHHADIARSLMSRGNFMAFIGEKHTAKADLQECVRMFEMALGKKHPRTVGARNAFAKFLSSLDVFTWLCNDGAHTDALDLIKSIPEYGTMVVANNTCVYLKDLEAQYVKAKNSVEQKAALDNFVKIAEFLMDIAGRDFLAAAHVVLQHGRKLSHEALNRQVERATSVERASSMAVLDKEKKLVKGQVEATQDDTVRIASVKMLTVLNDLYGRKRFKPHDDFDAIAEQKKALSEARDLLELAAPLKSNKNFKEEMELNEAMVLEGTGYLYLYNKEKVMSDEDAAEQQCGEYWFMKEIDVLYPGAKLADGTIELVQANIKTQFPVARTRKLADALNALGTAYEIKLKEQMKAEPANKPTKDHELYKQALAAYNLSVEVADTSGNQTDLARSYLSRGNLRKIIDDKEGIAHDLGMSVKLFREALGDNHPRTKVAHKSMSQFLTRLDVFVWLCQHPSHARVQELAKGNTEYMCQVVGLDPAKINSTQAAAVVSSVRGKMASVTEKTKSLSFKTQFPGMGDSDGSNNSRGSRNPCVYLEALDAEFNAAPDALGRKNALDHFVLVAQFLIEIGRNDHLATAHEMIVKGAELAQKHIQENEIKVAKGKMLGVLNELYGRKKYKPRGVDFDAVAQQNRALGEARTLLEEAKALKKKPEFVEEMIHDEAMVLEGTGYLYLFNRHKVMSEEDNRMERFGDYWFKKEIEVLYPDSNPFNEDEVLKFSDTTLKGFPVNRTRKLADALNALGTAYEKNLKNENLPDKRKATHAFYKKALSAYNLSVHVALISENQADVARSYMSRGNLEKLVGQKDKGVADLEKSVNLFEQALGEGHPRTKGARKALEDLKVHMPQTGTGSQAASPRASSSARSEPAVPGKGSFAAAARFSVVKAKQLPPPPLSEQPERGGSSRPEKMAGLLVRVEVVAAAESG